MSSGRNGNDDSVNQTVQFARRSKPAGAVLLSNCTPLRFSRIHNGCQFDTRKPSHNAGMMLSKRSNPNHTETNVFHAALISSDG
ncbi:MAG UNVERIFIED_CONTAM: hypothetical protein LVR18_22580 [Planctomycetaceae bacterium]|jgi:hypothetical protein